jgi:hypothetical protein
MPAFLGYKHQIRQEVKRFAQNAGGDLAANWFRSLYWPLVDQLRYKLVKIHRIVAAQEMTDEEAKKIEEMEEYEEELVSLLRPRSRLFSKRTLYQLNDAAEQITHLDVSQFARLLVN